jgi:hypothetical protein
MVTFTHSGGPRFDPALLQAEARYANGETARGLGESQTLAIGELRYAVPPVPWDAGQALTELHIESARLARQAQKLQQRAREWDGGIDPEDIRQMSDLSIRWHEWSVKGACAAAGLLRPASLRTWARHFWLRLTRRDPNPLLALSASEIGEVLRFLSTSQTTQPSRVRIPHPS